MQRNLTIILFMLLSCATCFGQTTFQGITPGKSTRAEIERVLGRPVKNVSKTLIEYKSPEEGARLYMQYRDESAAAVVERMELTCFDNDDVHDKCGPVLNAIEQLRGALNDKESRTPQQQGWTIVRHFGAPRFMVWTHIGKGVNAEERLAYYSPQLYESAVPKSGCTGTIFGTWQTDRGRMTVVRVGDSGIQGTYAKNNGSFSLKVQGNGYVGEWKDDTGSGSMAVLLAGDDSFNASMSRGPAASGSLSRITGLPPGDPLKGKCVP